MADLEKFKFLIVFGFEHHHFTTFMKYFFPKIFEIILCIQFSLPELGQFTWFLKKVENIQNCQKSANFHLPWAAPFCNFLKNFLDENTSFALHFYNFTTRGLNKYEFLLGISLMFIFLPTSKVLRPSIKCILGHIVQTSGHTDLHHHPPRPHARTVAATLNHESSTGTTVLT